MLNAKLKADRRSVRSRFKIRQTTNADYAITVRKTGRYIYLTLNDLKNFSAVFSLCSKKISEKSLNQEIALKCGEMFGDELKKRFKDNIPKLVYDRSGYLYHGRVKQAADGIRNKIGSQF